jgi:hypothetical protein
MPSIADAGLGLSLKAPKSGMPEDKVRPVAPCMVDAKSGTIANPLLEISMHVVDLSSHHVVDTVGNQT